MHFFFIIGIYLTCMKAYIMLCTIHLTVTRYVACFAYPCWWHFTAAVQAISEFILFLLSALGK